MIKTTEILEKPLKSLIAGKWFKLICGASFQDLPTIRSLAITYSLAGADCLDLAADPAVINAVKEGLKIAENLQEKAKEKGFLSYQKPWLMVSLNTAEDPHFRKAEFNPLLCPKDCPRPCEKICPALAINNNGVIDQKCYGCGRCIPICPLNLIETRSYIANFNQIFPLIQDLKIDAIEIHTQVGQIEGFNRLWQQLKPIISSLKLIAVSCQNHENVTDYLNNLYQIISPLKCALIWQTDGRPMSGDLGKGTTHPAIKMAEKLIKIKFPGFIQLAGGTNQYTVKKLKEKNLIRPDLLLENLKIQLLANQQFSHIAGVAYGSYARTLLNPIFEQLQTNETLINLEENEQLLWQSVTIASELVNQIKNRSAIDN